MIAIIKTLIICGTIVYIVRLAIKNDKDNK